MQKTMLINVKEPEESRVAVVEDGVLEEIYVERASAEQVVGNIYKGKTLNVEPAIQAAFIDIGMEKNGFLHASDIMVTGDDGAAFAEGRKRGSGRRVVPIEKLLHRGQEVVVQITKEGVGTKGPGLTGYISLPGRYLVLMPGVRHHGVSRKIGDDDERDVLRKALDEADPEKEFGLIARTAGAGVGKREITKDLKYLQRLWQMVEDRIKKSSAPTLVYLESDLVTRTIRDIYSPDIQEIIIDSEEVCKRAVDFLKVIATSCHKKVKFYRSRTPLFHKFRIEEELENISHREVALPHGGSIVIEQTEAMVTIDVNSGKFTQEKDAEAAALRTDLEAVPEIARQLRLRDMGGVIVIDFIDVREATNRRTIEKALHEAIKRDRARTSLSRMSRFGIIEMTRQRVRPGLNRTTYKDCPVCRGSGRVKTLESMALYAMRQLRYALTADKIERIELTVSDELGGFLQNEKRDDLVDLEHECQKRVYVRMDHHLTPNDMELACFDKAGSAVQV